MIACRGKRQRWVGGADSMTTVSLHRPANQHAASASASASASPCGRIGMSLVEVTITIVLLTVALGAMVQIMGEQYQRRRIDETRAAANTIAQQLSERILTARWEWLATDRLPWSFGRYLDLQGVGGARPPMTVRAADPEDDLAVQDLLPPTLAEAGGDSNIEVFIEWYRGYDAPADSGIVSRGALTAAEGVTSTRDFHRAVHFNDLLPPESPVEPAFREIRGPANDVWSHAGTVSPTAYLVDTEPLLARIIVRWNSSAGGLVTGRQSLVLWIARTP
jgi:type II secretory pathway pseudopilin PulG